MENLINAVLTLIKNILASFGNEDGTSIIDMISDFFASLKKEEE